MEVTASTTTMPTGPTPGYLAPDVRRRGPGHHLTGPAPFGAWPATFPELLPCRSSEAYPRSRGPHLHRPLKVGRCTKAARGGIHPMNEVTAKGGRVNRLRVGPPGAERNVRPTLVEHGEVSRCSSRHLAVLDQRGSNVPLGPWRPHPQPIHTTSLGCYFIHRMYTASGGLCTPADLQGPVKMRASRPRIGLR